MTKDFSRRAFVAGLGALWGSAASGQAPSLSLRPVARPGGAVTPGAASPAKPAVRGAQSIIREAGVSGKTAYAVADVKTGQMLEVSDVPGGQPPASVTKAITALYALAALGPGHRFETRIITSAPPVGGVVAGDIFLAGGGDPSLDKAGLAAMVAQLASAGVTRVQGKFYVWGGALPSLHEIDRDQPDHVGYNPAVSGIALNYNRVHFEWKRQGNSYGVTMDARSDTMRPAVKMARMQVVNRALPIYTYADKAGVDQWSVAREALGSGGSRWLPVRQPEIYAGEVFQALAAATGIKVPAPQISRGTPQGTVLVRRQSAPVADILRDMLEYSTNLTAEMVGIAASLARGAAGNSLRASAEAMSRWAKSDLGMTVSTFEDHSGLGDGSRASAADMVNALLAARRAGLLPGLLKTIDMRDAKGKVIKGHPVRVVAKTGTLNFVSALAGYVTGPDGTEMAFAIFSADQGARGRIKASERELPPGGPQWNKKAKALQQVLLQRWGQLYGA